MLTQQEDLAPATGGEWNVEEAASIAAQEDPPTSAGHIRAGVLPCARQSLVGPISDPAALSIVWRAALGVLVASTSMRPFISLSCSREHDRLKGGASVLCLVPSAAMR